MFIKDSITSLEVLEQINLFRKLEYDYKIQNGIKLGKVEEKNKKATLLLHQDLLNIIRDEFEEEIQARKISVLSYIAEVGNGAKKELPMYQLSLKQAKQILMRESKFVRKAVIEYIEKLESQYLPQDLPTALRMLADKEEQRLKEQKEKEKFRMFVDFKFKLKVNYATKVIAKRLNTSSNKLYKILREKGIIENKEFRIDNEDGSYIIKTYWDFTKKYKNKDYGKLEKMRLHNIPYLKWNDKGIDFICNLLWKEKMLNIDLEIETKKENEQKLLDKHTYKQNKIHEYYKNKLGFKDI